MSQEDLDELVDKKIFNEIPADEPWQLDLESQGSFFPCNVHQLTAGTVIKYSHNKIENGKFMMTYVQQHTTISIPTIRRHWRDSANNIAFTVMNYIPSNTLQNAWSKLSVEEQF